MHDTRRIRSSNIATSQVTSFYLRRALCAPWHLKHCSDAVRLTIFHFQHSGDHARRIASLLWWCQNEKRREQRTAELTARWNEKSMKTSSRRIERKKPNGARFCRPCPRPGLFRHLANSNTRTRFGGGRQSAASAQSTHISFSVSVSVSMCDAAANSAAGATRQNPCSKLRLTKPMMPLNICAAPPIPFTLSFFLSPRRVYIFPQTQLTIIYYCPCQLDSRLNCRRLRPRQRRRLCFRSSFFAPVASRRTEHANLNIIKTMDFHFAARDHHPYPGPHVTRQARPMGSASRMDFSVSVLHDANDGQIHFGAGRAHRPVYFCIFSFVSMNDAASCLDPRERVCVG